METSNAELRDIANGHAQELERFEASVRRSKDRADRHQKCANLQRTVHDQRIRAQHQGYSADANRNLHEYAIDISPLESADPSSQHAYLASLPSAAVLRPRLTGFRSNNDVLEQMNAALQSRSIELESLYRKVVSRCTQEEEGKVDGLLEQLLAAVESEEGDAEVGRVKEFLRKVET